MKKKILSALLATLMLATMLSGCNYNRRGICNILQRRQWLRHGFQPCLEV